MPKQTRTTKSQQAKRNQQTRKSDSATKQVGEQTTLATLPVSLISSPSDASIQTQAARLSDSRFQVTQRQAMAAQLGQMGGNQYLQRVMAQVAQPDHAGQHTGESQPKLTIKRIGEPAEGQFVQRAPAPALTRAGQEAKARKTLTLCRNAVRWMRRQREPIFKNTAELLSGGAGGGRRLRWQSLTLRHDSAKMVARRGEDPRKRAYFFYGPKEDNAHACHPNAGGTVEDNTILVRAIRPGGVPLKEWQIADIFVHEASHILTESYGTYPESASDEASFDYYKDEFRAYWVTPRRFPPSKYATDDDRARAIRNHIVGTGPRSPCAYPELHVRYWGSADQPQSKHPDHKFRRLVNAHRRPDGYNIEHNPRLDRLFQMLKNYKGGMLGSSSLKPLCNFIRNKLSEDERKAARVSPLIRKLINNNIPHSGARWLVRNTLGILGG